MSNFVHRLRRLLIDALKADALDVLEGQLLRTAKVEAVNPNNVPPGELRMVVKRDPNNNSESRIFIGQDSFIRLPNFGCDMQCHGGYREGRRTTLRQMQQTAERLIRMVK